MSFKALPIFVFLTCGFLTFISTNKTGVYKMKSGPYVSVFKRFVECKKLLKPYAKELIGVLSHEIKNNVVKGNLTVLRKKSNCQISLQDFFYEDGQWQLTFDVRNITCRNKWLAALLALLNIKHDKKTCGLAKGTYVFAVDGNRVDHVWMSTREYGRLLHHVEVHSREETILCFEVESDIVPVK